MTDMSFRIFPRDCITVYDDSKIISTINILKLYSNADITFTNYKNTQFIDCGQGLEHIYCPWCGYELETMYWQSLMDRAYIGNTFRDLSIITPCCRLSSSLDKLIYIKPCGFATFVIEVLNPQDIPCDVELHEMSKGFRQINFFKIISVRI